MVKVSPTGILSKDRGRLVADTRPDPDLGYAVGNIVGWGIVRQAVACCVIVGRPRHLRCCQRHEGVRSLEKMVLKGGLVDLGDEIVFVCAVRHRRIKMLGTLRERGVQYLPVRFTGRIGAVPGDITAGTEQEGSKKKEGKQTEMPR